MDSSCPLVSIIIPTYERVCELERAINSIICQTYDEWEVIVIDNHSSDGTDEIISLFNDPRIKLYKIHNMGVIAASRNFGIKVSSGKYIAFLDSDDWWKKNKLEESVKYLGHGYDVVYHDMFLVKKDSQKLFLRKTRSRDLIAPVFQDLISNGNAINNSSAVIRRDALIKINGLTEEEELIAAEDYDGWLRVAKISDKFKKVPGVLGYYWLGGGNTSNPARTIKTIEALERVYADDILILKSNNCLYYYDYVKARACYSMGNYLGARNI